MSMRRFFLFHLRFFVFHSTSRRNLLMKVDCLRNQTSMRGYFPWSQWLSLSWARLMSFFCAPYYELLWLLLSFQVFSLSFSHCVCSSCVFHRSKNLSRKFQWKMRGWNAKGLREENFSMRSGWCKKAVKKKGWKMRWGWKNFFIFYKNGRRVEMNLNFCCFFENESEEFWII